MYRWVVPMFVWPARSCTSRRDIPGPSARAAVVMPVRRPLCDDAPWNRRAAYHPRKSACTACHAVDKKIVGPSFKDVAAKYRTDKGAEAKLVEKVKKGGVGVWGQVPMPPNSPQVKDADIQTLVKWVLSLK